MTPREVIADNPERRPVMLESDLRTLDDDEIVEGYMDGLHNEPCGGNRSRSYWHGWRNGMVDGKHAEIDAAQHLLAQDVVRNKRVRAMIAAAKEG